MRNSKSLTSRWAPTIANALLFGMGSGAMGHAATAPLLTPSQYQIDKEALALRNDPAVVSASRKVIESWDKLPLAQLPDGKATLNDAVNELVYVALRSTVADPSRPQVIWTEAPAYKIHDLSVPSGRGGDSPDRIYRFAALDPHYQYTIHGHRNARPSLSEFSFEATRPPAVYGPVLSHLSSDAIDVAADGSFTVTADATPADGRRNHLYLPPGTASVLIRDTLVDWSSQLPNDVSIERIGGKNAPTRSHAELAQEAAKEIAAIADIDLPFLQLVTQTPANQVTPRVRPLAWGMPGSGLALNQFSLKKGEAWVVTLDPLGGKYLGFVVGDPWQRSVTYWNRSGSLNNHQSKPNPDGTITYVIAAQDPGVYNWLDTNGLQDGVVTIRWEGLPPDTDIQKGVKSTQVVAIAKLATVLPDAPRISTQERGQIFAQRQAEYTLRVSAN